MALLRNFILRVVQNIYTVSKFFSLMALKWLCMCQHALKNLWPFELNTQRLV